MHAPSPARIVSALTVIVALVSALAVPIGGQLQSPHRAADTMGRSRPARDLAQPKFG